MPKECDCLVGRFGLSTLYPIHYNYCPKCGNKLIYISWVELRKRIMEITK